MNDVRSSGVTNRFEIRVEEKTHIGADGTPVPAILDLVLGVEPDSMTVLMGPSGCGKTTLLRIIAHLDDRFVGDAGVRETARLGFMFQEPRLLPWRTVQQNIELVAPTGFSEADLQQLAAAVGIADMLPRYPQELSLGLARRVALARAFATRPGVVEEGIAGRLLRLAFQVIALVDAVERRLDDPRILTRLDFSRTVKANPVVSSPRLFFMGKNNRLLGSLCLRRQRQTRL